MPADQTICRLFLTEKQFYDRVFIGQDTQRVAVIRFKIFKKGVVRGENSVCFARYYVGQGGLADSSGSESPR